MDLKELFMFGVWFMFGSFMFGLITFMLTPSATPTKFVKILFSKIGGGFVKNFFTFKPYIFGRPPVSLFYI